jgi:hypothetical protein
MPEEVPPSPEALSLVDVMTGDAEMGEWVWLGGELALHRIDAATSSGNYIAFVDTTGRFHWLQYQDVESGKWEAPHELTWSGTRQLIALADVRESALRTLRDALPEVTADSAWTARSAVGTRYAIGAEDWVFYFTPEGSIRAGGLTMHGAGEEVDSAAVDDSGPITEDVEDRMHELLGPYRSRFNLDGMIKTLKAQDKGEGQGFRFVVFGDSRSQFELWSAMVRHIDQLAPKPAFVIVLGDIVVSGHVEEFRDYYIPPLLETDIPYFVAIGNHDDGDEGQATEYRYLFGDNSLNYHFDHGGIRFVFMDNVTAVQPYDRTLSWLDRVLSETPPGNGKLVFAHRPPADIEKWAYHAWSLEESRIFTETMTRRGVEHVFLGHIHAYSTATWNGVHYTVTGGGGAGLHDRYGPQGNVHHYVIVDVLPDGRLRQTVVRFHLLESVETRDAGE